MRCGLKCICWTRKRLVEEQQKYRTQKGNTVCPNSSRLNTHAVLAQLLAKGKEGTWRHQKLPKSHLTLVFLSRSINFRLKSVVSLLEGESRNPIPEAAGTGSICAQRKAFAKKIGHRNGCCRYLTNQEGRFCTSGV